MPVAAETISTTESITGVGTPASRARSTHVTRLAVSSSMNRCTGVRSVILGARRCHSESLDLEEPRLRRIALGLQDGPLRVVRAREAAGELLIIRGVQGTVHSRGHAVPLQVEPGVGVVERRIEH